jgi:hypothetical protein
MFFRLAKNTCKSQYLAWQLLADQKAKERMLQREKWTTTRKHFRKGSFRSAIKIAGRTLCTIPGDTGNQPVA